MEPDGTVTLTTGLQSNGQGHETTMAQLAADELGVALEDVKVVQGDTAGTAYATGSYGSRTAVIGSGAIIRAAGDVRDKLLGIAAHLFEAAPDDLELAEGRISVLGSPEKSFTIREVATAAYWGPRPDDIDPALVATRSYDPPETYSNACIAVVAEIDADTGQVHIERIVAVEDCGTVLNPAVVEGQVIGAIAQGIGAVLYEQLPVRRGRELPGGHARRLPLPDRAGGARDRGRPPRDAVAGDRGRLQGHGRGRPDRRPLRDRQRDLGRPRRAGGSHPAAALRRARARRDRTFGLRYPSPGGCPHSPSGRLRRCEASHSSTREAARRRRRDGARARVRRAGRVGGADRSPSSRSPPGLAPEAMTLGPDGNVWFVDTGANRIVRVTPDGTMTPYSTGIGASAGLAGITAGPDGNIYFTESNRDRIGRINLTTFVITESAPMGGGSDPRGITAGPDGALWFAEGTDDRIGRMTTGLVSPTSSTSPATTCARSRRGRTGTSGSRNGAHPVRSAASPRPASRPNYPTTAGQPTGIAAGPDGNIWFAASENPGAIGRITTSGTITLFTTGLTTNSAPLDIVAGADGNLYFTENASPGRLGQITTAGAITEFSTGLTTASGPWGIASGADGNIWFTENAGNRVGQAQLRPWRRDRSGHADPRVGRRARRHRHAALAGDDVQVRLGPDERIRLEHGDRPAPAAAHPRSP